MRYDIVVATKNSEKYIVGCVAALAAQRYSLAQLHLIFVDNASQDGSLAVLEQEMTRHASFGGFSVVKNQKDAGEAAARNQGAAQGTAPHIFFLHADGEVSPNLFEKLDAALETADAQAAVFECRQLPFEAEHHINPATLETGLAVGAALLVKRSVFEEIGGFDAHLAAAWDVDLSWRIRAAGYKLFYLPAAEVTGRSFEERETPETQLLAYAGALLSNLLLRYKYGSFGAVIKGHAMYWKALRRPRHFPGVRKVLLQGYLRHFLRLWPFWFWHFAHKAQYKAGVACFMEGFGPVRGFFPLQKPGAQPLVSVVVRTCNRPDTLRETLKSLARQTYHNFEVIVVEDGPDSGSAMILREFPGLRLQYKATGEKVGRAKAGNTGLALAKGEYCNFLDDDDYFYPDHLELMVSVAAANPEADIVTAASMAMAADVQSAVPYVLKVKEIYPIRQNRINNFMFCQSCMVSIQSVFFKRELFTKLGGLNENLEGDEDWSMWLKYFAAGRRVNAQALDITRATSVFLVPADPEKEAARLAAYRGYEDAMLDDPSIKFTVTPRQMRQYYEGMIADMRHLQEIGELQAFLQKGGRKE